MKRLSHTTESSRLDFHFSGFKRIAVSGSLLKDWFDEAMEIKSLVGVQKIYVINHSRPGAYLTDKHRRIRLDIDTDEVRARGYYGSVEDIVKHLAQGFMELREDETGDSANTLGVRSFRMQSGLELGKDKVYEVSRDRLSPFWQLRLKYD